MAYSSLSEFAAALDRAGELKRITAPVATELEITALADREMKSPGGGKPARFPVAINTMGSTRRMAMARLSIGGWSYAANRLSQWRNKQVPKVRPDPTDPHSLAGNSLAHFIASGRVVKEEIGGSNRAREKDGSKQRDGITLEAFCSMDHGEVNRQGVSARVGAVAEDELTENDWVTQSLLGIVVGWGHAVDLEEGKEPVIVAFRVQESLTQVLGIWVLTRLLADAAERGVKGGAFGFGFGKGKLTGIPHASNLTRAVREIGRAS